jgi:hypothetical protein
VIALEIGPCKDQPKIGPGDPAVGVWADDDAHVAGGTMIAQSHTTADTHLTPAPFRDGADQRRSPRVPFDARVRVGPAYGAPYATVSAENLSAGGIFIVTDKPARVGAQFSLELGLPGGDTLYVPEVEVLYNRNDERLGAPGFGARFSVLAEEVRGILDRLATFPSDIVAPEGKAVSGSMILGQRTARPSPTLETVAPAPLAPSEPPTVRVPQRDIPTERVGELAMSLPPEPLAASVPPALSDPWFDGELPSEVRGPRTEETDMVRDRTPRTSDPEAVVQRTRRRLLIQDTARPMLIAGLISGAVVVLLLAGLFLRGAPSAVASEAGEPAERRGMRGDTHDVLVGAREAPVGVDPVEPSDLALPGDRAATRKLPELVTLEQARAAAKADRKPAPAAVPAAVEPKAKASEAKKATKPAPSKIDRSKPGVAGVRIAVPKGAKVRKAPDRFVVDVEGLDGFPAVPAASGSIKAIRAGRHDGFTRLVFDAKRPIKAGEASVKAGQLRVELQF